jgi:hypothetical protein
MRLILYSVIMVASINSCKKQDNINSNCFADATTNRIILNKPASIKLLRSKFYIIEQGTIDSQLNPCNLPLEFQTDKLNVTISGEVKATIQNGLEPCCIDDFVITKITR